MKKKIANSDMDKVKAKCLCHALFCGLFELICNNSFISKSNLEIAFSIFKKLSSCYPVKKGFNNLSCCNLIELTTDIAINLSAKVSVI